MGLRFTPHSDVFFDVFLMPCLSALIASVGIEV